MSTAGSRSRTRTARCPRWVKSADGGRSGSGTFETCRRSLKRSAYGRRPEVIGARSERRDRPTRDIGKREAQLFSRSEGDEVRKGSTTRARLSAHYDARSLPVIARSASDEAIKLDGFAACHRAALRADPSARNDGQTRLGEDGFRGVYHRARIRATRWLNPSTCPLRPLPLRCRRARRCCGIRRRRARVGRAEQ